MFTEYVLRPICISQESNRACDSALNNPCAKDLVCGGIHNKWDTFKVKENVK